MPQTNGFKSAAEELIRVSRALKTLNECNRALVNLSEETELLQQVCRTIVETGGYRLAWVGLVSENGKKAVRPVAQAGYEAGYLETVRITWGDDENGGGPTGTAIRTGRPCVLQNVQKDPHYEPWREQAIRRGCGSSIALPLKIGTWVFGALNVYAAEFDAFDEAEVKLLSELSANISFGIKALREKSRVERLESQLRESEEKYDLLADNSKEGIYLSDSVGLEYVNRAFEAITGYTAAETNGPGFDLLSLLLPEDRALIRERLERETLGLRILPSAEFRIRTKSGQIKHIENNTVLLPSPPQRILGILRDVTDRKMTEGQLKQMMAMMRHTLDAVILAIGRTVELRDPYTAGHQRRVADLSRAIAREIGLPQDKIDGLGMASLIHDLGKISVPAEILSKPGRLSEMEYTLIKSHPQFGFDILGTIDFPWPVAQIVLQHHERMNGSGYPSGLDDGSILIEARILGLADVVEAMISHRPYRPALGLEDALGEISKNRGTLYDGQAVEACQRLFLEDRFHFQSEAVHAEASS